jgi:hypothetical protein
MATSTIVHVKFHQFTWCLTFIYYGTSHDLIIITAFKGIVVAKRMSFEDMSAMEVQANYVKLAD